LAEDAWLDGIREVPAFEEILNTARKRHGRARAAFCKAGGEDVLSPQPQGA
jgi:hypothetical protein